MLNPIPKMLVLGAFTAISLGGTWLLLDDPATNRVECGPVSEGVSAPSDCDDPHLIQLMPDEDEPGPAHRVEPELLPASRDDDPEGEVEQRTNADYRDGDLVSYTARDDKGNIREVGTYRVLLLHNERDAKQIAERNKLRELTRLTEELERVIDKRAERILTDELRERAEIERLNGEDDFEAERVPEGWTAFKVKHGTWTHYFADSTRLSEQVWQDGLRDGAHYRWNANGTLVTSGHYVAGKKDGRWEQWNASGQRTSETHYQADKLHGSYVAYHGNGRVSVEGQYEEGNAVGLWNYYNEDGSLNQSLEQDKVKKQRERIVSKVRISRTTSDDLEDEANCVAPTPPESNVRVRK